MKPSKIIFGLFIVQVVFVFAAPPVFSQTETLDMVQYTPPPGWSKTVKEGAVVFVSVDRNANTFCALTIYSGTASMGSATKDFAADWKTFVVTPHKAEEHPKTETEIKDGWTVTSANAPIESEGIKALAVLVVYTGFGKTTSILAILNSDIYIKPLAAFMETVKLDKTPIASAPSAPANAPPVNSNGNSYDPASLVGKWGNGIAGNTVSGNIIQYGSNASQKYYQFNADGTYSFIYSGYSGLAGTMGSFHISMEESGVYALNGDSMTITPKKSQTKSNSEGLRNNPLETVTYRWTIHYFAGSEEYALILHPDHQTKRDGGFDYIGGFPDSYIYSQIK